MKEPGNVIQTGNALWVDPYIVYDSEFIFLVIPGIFYRESLWPFFGWIPAYYRGDDGRGDGSLPQTAGMTDLGCHSRHWLSGIHLGLLRMDPRRLPRG